jgi:hypothetical protein
MNLVIDDDDVVSEVCLALVQRIEERTTDVCAAVCAAVGADEDSVGLTWLMGLIGVFDQLAQQYGHIPDVKAVIPRVAYNKERLAKAGSKMMKKEERR